MNRHTTTVMLVMTASATRFQRFGSDAEKKSVLERTRTVLGGKEFVAGAFVGDVPGAAFDLPAYGGGTLTADEVARVTASNLDPEFGRVATTEQLTGR